MKIEGQKGDYAFKALIQNFTFDGKENGWQLSSCFYFSREEIRNIANGARVKWPVEMVDRDCIYIPSEEEL